MVHLGTVYAADDPTTPSELGDRAFFRLTTMKSAQIQGKYPKMMKNHQKTIKNHQKSPSAGEGMEPV